MKEGYIEIESLKIPSSFESINRVEVLIDSVCRRLSVNEDYYGNVLIAVTEAVNNAIQHGNKGSTDLTVDLYVTDKEMDFCFRVKDYGDGFDYEKLPDPTSPENIEQENGRGVYLMRSLAEAVEFGDGGRSVDIYFSKK
jgi:serine/threonine-protein kinase RsbW